MKKRKAIFCIVMILCFSLLVSCASKGNGKGDGAGTGKAKVSDYFPFTENIHMVYKGEGNEYASYETYVEYIKDNIMQTRVINPGTTSVVVYEIKNGELKRILNRGETYHRYDYTSVKRDEEIILKEPIKEGTSWTLKDGSKKTITAVDKSISTPLGNYTALEVTTESQNSTITEYYVKNIGLVKSIFKLKGDKMTDDNYTVTSTLEKIEENASLKENAKFYFPDYNSGQLAYVNRKIEFRTNQTVEEVIEKAMKELPKNSSLSSVLSDNTKILSIRLDDNKDLVTVDFSSHLLTEMNAGTSLESMILQSIANTIGEYFQKQNVKITVEGKPYSSGHILMEENEYFTVNTEGCYEYK